jgi:hypothetical protein
VLRPIQHRGYKAQGVLMIIRVRAALIAVRTSLVNTARGLAKSKGERLPKCDADQMGVLQAVTLAQPSGWEVHVQMDRQILGRF